MKRCTRRRVVLGRRWGLLGLVVWVVLAPDAVAADPPGPTDFRSEVVAVQPADAPITVRVLGSDAFIELAAAPGVRVSVPGYRGEPYLDYAPDGVVRENRASYSYHVNRARFGADPPDIVDLDAVQWHRVAADGRYAWHDHRTHWMARTGPPGASRGEVILESDIVVEVDGEPVVIRVAVVWLADPSPVAVWVGFGLGLVAMWYVIARSRRTGRAAGLLAVAATVALALGALHLLAVSPALGPRPVWVLMPALALVAAVVAAWSRRGMMAGAALAVGGAELTIWAWTRRDHLDAAWLPTLAPYPLDRGGTVAIALASLAIVGVGLVSLWVVSTTPVRNVTRAG